MRLLSTTSALLLCHAAACLGQNAPPEPAKREGPLGEAAAGIERYLDALGGRQRARRADIEGFVDLGLGHDSNVSVSSSSAEFAIPGLPLMSLGNEEPKQRDEFFSLAAGIFGRYRLTDSLSLTGNASLAQQRNFHLHAFDTGDYRLGGAVNLARDANDFVLGYQAERFRIGDERFRDSAGWNAQWRRSVGKSDQVTLYGQSARLTFPTERFRDADRTVLGTAWAHDFGASRRSVYLGAYLGGEDARDAAAPEFGNRLWGARLGGEMLFGERWTGFATLAYETRHYREPDPLFLVNRRDRETVVTLGAIYRLERGWSISPALTRIENRSNVEPNAFERTLATLTLGYDF